MKFLHTADLHLDSAFCSSGALGAEQQRQRQRELLKKIFNLANKESCDMILIAGDLFDSSFVTPETRRLCLELFAEFEKPIIISPGNHDAFTDGSFYKSMEMPENVYIFTSSELQFFDFPSLEVTVAGYAFTSAALTANPLGAPVPERSNEKIRLLCAHTELDNPTTKYAPVLSSDIIRYGFDYAALGHVHSPKDSEGNIRYCGFAEGRSFDELGDGGVLVVSVEVGEPPLVTRHIISDIRYIRSTLELDDAVDSDDIALRIEQKIVELSSSGCVALRIELTGVIPPDTMTDIKIIEAKRREGVAVLEIEDSTLALPNKSFLEKDQSLRGEFYRSLRSALYSDSPEERAIALKALKIGLAAIEGGSL